MSPWNLQSTVPRWLVAGQKSVISCSGNIAPLSRMSLLSGTYGQMWMLQLYEAYTTNTVTVFCPLHIWHNFAYLFWRNVQQFLLPVWATESGSILKLRSFMLVWSAWLITPEVFISSDDVIKKSTITLPGLPKHNCILTTKKKVWQYPSRNFREKNILPESSDSSRKETFYIVVAFTNLHETKAVSDLFF